MEPFKNLLSFSIAQKIAAAVKDSFPAFNDRAFLRGLPAELEDRELKARVEFLAQRLEHHLPQDPNLLFPILIGALAHDDNDRIGLKSFSVWPLTEIVARQGLPHFPLAMEALGAMTERFTSEFAIRPFLAAEPERTLQQLLQWTEHPNEHRRRLASEGSRPLLPWGGKLHLILAHPNLTRPILDRLHADPSEYVRKSVANHLNDFSKTNPAHIIATLRSWKKTGHPTFPKLAARAARTLIKNGHPDALLLIGVQSSAKLICSDFRLLKKQIPIGDKFPFQLTITNPSRRPADALLDYALHFRRANGEFSRKVFKGRRKNLAPGESWTVHLSHPFRPITTRTYYPGQHRLEPLLNGHPLPAQTFQLQKSG
jgi:3-methyladenine DNA glycosylase AlkC